MAQTEPKQGQAPANMRLSAEAEAFVPGKYKGRGGMGFVSGSMSTPAVNAQQHGAAGEVPHYITSCYPFVNGDPTTTVRGPTQWSGPGRPPVPHLVGHRMPRPQAGAHLYTGSRPPGPQQYPGRMLRPPGLPLLSPPGMVAPHVPTVPPHVQSFNQSSNTSHNFGYIPNYHHPGGHSPNWPPSQYGGDYQSHPGMYSDAAGYNLNNHQETSDTWSGSERSKSSEHSRGKNKKDNMVSVGIQNEVGTISAVNIGHNYNHNLPSPGRKRTRTRTIILMDAANQTDFSEEIANLTLAERPNSLYNRTRTRSRRTEDYTSTDSEEESDSGYSSPLHRRNQISSGTHPAVSLVPSLPNNDAQGFVSAQGPIYSINDPVHHSNTGPLVVGYGNNGYTSPYVNGYQTVPPSPYLGSNNANLEGLNNTLVKPDAEDENGSGKKKRRKNKRKKKKLSGEETGALSDEHVGLYHAQSSSNVSRTSGEAVGYEVMDTLHFEDEEEFPGLQSSNFAQATPSTPSVALSYSQIVQSTSQQPSLSQGLSQELLLQRTETASHTSAHSAHTSQASKESKNAKKRRKRREMANRAAEEEMAEISLEQTVLIEQMKQQQKQRQQTTPEPKKKQAVKAGEKTKAPVSLNIAAMLDAFEKQQEQKQAEEEDKAHKKESKPSSTIANPLDASAPAKRGKERETPKPKKPSPLKKVILKEREERKRSRLLDDTALLTPPSASATNTSSMISMPGMGIESDLSQDGSKTSREETVASNPGSAELSPISQTSPISMSPLTPGGSPLSSGVNSPVAANAVLRETRTSSLAMKIHSRRFREYCNQILEKEIDSCCTALLQDLVRFQDRLYHKDPVKAKSKRRIVLGLREVTKHLKLRKIKCVVISPNLERIQSKGGLDEALNTIITMCQEQDVPFVFALGRRALGRACAKLVPVSVVGVFNYEGTEENFRNLMKLTEQAREAYRDMVQILEKEMTDNPLLRTGTMPAQLFAHMGHSRTPSACSAISFTSSILSEPISENYPHSEPETDSRGYEIVKISEKEKAAAAIVSIAEAGLHMTHSNNIHNTEANRREDRSDSPNSSSCGQSGKNVIMESLNDIDEGHEADTEDLNDNGHDKPQEENPENVTESQDKAGELPHIDSIHSSVVDLSVEILSQHSSKTLDLNNTEALSTHSYKTAECASAGNRSGEQTPGEKSRHQSGNRTDEEYTGQKVRHSDKDRVESWVAQLQIENLKICEADNGESQDESSESDTDSDQQNVT